MTFEDIFTVYMYLHYSPYHKTGSVPTCVVQLALFGFTFIIGNATVVIANTPDIDVNVNMTIA